MMNFVFVLMIAAGAAAFVISGDGAGALGAMTAGCAKAVELIFSLAGAYIFWMGIMKIAERAGLVKKLAGKMEKPLSRLMPGAERAAGPVTLNLAANFFGLGNAATPFGVAAMRELSDGTGGATDNMAMFIALNASAVELLPTAVIAIRTACGSSAPYSVAIPTFIASIASAAAAVVSCRLLARVVR